MKILLYLTIICIFASRCQNSSNAKLLSRITNLPSFSIKLEGSGHVIDTKTFSVDSPTVLIYFSPDCQYCQYEIENLLDNINRFRQARILLVTNESSEGVDSFSAKYKLYRFQNILIGKDYNYTFYRNYLPSSVPYVAVYDRKKNLKRVYEGEPDINLIADLAIKETN